MPAPRIILASQSPRRRELLALIGLAHEVRPADIDETCAPGEQPRAYAERLAREKAARIASADAIVIGSDTIVVVDGNILGKPTDPADAARMLRLLRGRSHTVITAVAVRNGERVESGAEEVTVTFHDLRDDDIRRYVATGEPMDKAGAYGIQGFGATIVRAVDGDYFAVMGLPLQLLVRLMARLGYRYTFGGLEPA